ncbi:17786_t:CDS:2 [Racocetra fulgida]|uniref:17786_t:CDS:1 n=1 Tax=Racocetra fulgida TaxID=60492 RepID=A0A9N9GBX3_9GLOM|nr:17786_t:CDS:2 [Racocetra fulgida]
MYNEESSQNINNNLPTEWTVGFTQDQADMNLLNIYNNPSIEWPADFTQGYENQINKSLSTEWHKDLSQDQTHICLPNGYNNSFIEWSEGFSQDQANNNIPIAIEWFTNNDPFMKWDTGFTQYQTSTSVTQNDENQIDCNSSLEWTAFFTQDQTNTSLLNIYNAQHCEEQINTLQQHDTKSEQKYKRRKNYNVILKILNNSEKMDADFLNELLHLISIRLNLVHKNKIIHCDLHSGNILIGHYNGYSTTPTIADLGISKPIDELSDKNAIYGVILYIAPEVLKGERFTQASDIYSFGMIIWEVISGCRPFSDHKHDEYLILDILNSLCPKIPSSIPQDLIELMETCWHQDPEKKNYAKRKFTVQKKGFLSRYELNELREEQRNGGLANALSKLIEKANKGEIKFPENIDTSILPTKTNDQAIYSSRPLIQLISKALTLQSMRLDSNVITGERIYCIELYISYFKHKLI